MIDRFKSLLEIFIAFLALLIVIVACLVIVVILACIMLVVIATEAFLFIPYSIIWILTGKFYLGRISRFVWSGTFGCLE